MSDTYKNNFGLTVAKTSTFSGRNCTGRSGPKGLCCSPVAPASWGNLMDLFQNIWQVWNIYTPLHGNIGPRFNNTENPLQCFCLTPEHYVTQSCMYLYLCTDIRLNLGEGRSPHENALNVHSNSLLPTVHPIWVKAKLMVRKGSFQS